jgi:glucokinase
MGDVVSIDVGAVNLRAALVDRDSKKLRKVHKEAVDCEDLMRQIYSIVDKIGKFRGIGISMPGTLDMNRGILCYSPNLNLRNINVVELMQDRYHVDVSLSNDETAAVMGEKLFGAGKKLGNVVHLTLGTGIGCGVILNDRLLLGKDGNAHEVGHVTIDASGAMRCGCGAMGHWEAYCSGRDIPNFARLLLDTRYRNEKSVLKGMRKLSTRSVYGAARSDKVAAKIVNEVGRLNAIGIANIIDCYDPELITIGGAIALNHQSTVLKPILAQVKSHAINKVPKIMITPLGETASLYGAVADFL